MSKTIMKGDRKVLDELNKSGSNPKLHKKIFTMRDLVLSLLQRELESRHSDIQDLKILTSPNSNKFNVTTVGAQIPNMFGFRMVNNVRIMVRTIRKPNLASLGCFTSIKKYFFL